MCKIYGLEAGGLTSFSSRITSAVTAKVGSQEIGLLCPFEHLSHYGIVTIYLARARSAVGLLVGTIVLLLQEFESRGVMIKPMWVWTACAMLSTLDLPKRKNGLLK